MDTFLNHTPSSKNVSPMSGLRYFGKDITNQPCGLINSKLKYHQPVQTFESEVFGSKGVFIEGGDLMQENIDPMESDLTHLEYHSSINVNQSIGGPVCPSSPRINKDSRFCDNEMVSETEERQRDFVEEDDCRIIELPALRLQPSISFQEIREPIKRSNGSYQEDIFSHMISTKV